VRAEAANVNGASACVSLHLGGGLPEASGPTCSYFGSDLSHSPAGMRLAGLILQELESEFACRGRLQRLSTAMLRETRMPAVQVEPLFITNREEAAMIADPAFAARTARALAGGLRRFFRG
jgi:N-acetylmuramoyl-L-alanine amidase